MLCLYLTQPLTVDEKSKLTYSYAFREFTSEGAGDDGAMTPERQALVDSINEIKQDIAQANVIGAEMCTTLTFRIQVTLQIRLDYNCSSVDTSLFCCLLFCLFLLRRAIDQN